MNRRDAALALLLGVIPIVAALPGGRAAALKLGPNAGAYLEGFQRSYEISGLEATRWATRDATVTLPLLASGPVEVSYRLSRVLRSADVAVDVGGRPLDRFEAHGGAFVERRASLDLPAGTSLRLRFVTSSEDPSPRGLRFDWIRVAALPGGRLRPSALPLFLFALAGAGSYLLLRFVGHGSLAAAALLTPLALAGAAGVHLDPLGFAHVVLRLVPIGLALAAGAALVLRAQPAGRWALLAFLLAFFGRGALLVHPRSFYPDFGNARRFIVALSETEGDLASRGVAAQVKTNVGYPRTLAGRAYAFPYSPLFFLPGLWPSDPDAIEEVYRIAGLVPASLEVLAVFLLARLGFPRSSLAPAAASLLAAVLPPVTSRLLLAMTVTLVGHLADVLLLAAALFYLRRPDPRRLGLVFAAALASQLLYVSSLFTVSAFLLCLAGLERRHASKLLAVLAVAGGVTVLWLYHPFLRAFFGEILPAVAAGARMEGRAGGGGGGLGSALGRIPIFYGWAFPLLAACGLALSRARGDGAARSVFSAYALAFALLVGLRAFGGGLFRDLKEIEFVAPLVAIATALFLEGLAAAGRRRAALLVGVGLGLYGASRAADIVVQNLSPFTEIRSDQPR